MKSFCRGFNKKNFFQKHPEGLCAVFLETIDQCKNSCEGEGLKFVFKFRLVIPEIGGHALAEGSRLSVPAPRRVQIFFQV